MEITFEFATRDDCLDRMVPSDLRKLIAERDNYRTAEKELGAAYLRIRTLLNAFNTPHMCTAEQVWEHTEGKVRQLLAITHQLEENV